MANPHSRPDLLARKNTFVYFARAYPSGLIKIGFSGTPNGRAHSLAWEFGEGVSLLFTTPGNRVQENGFHKRFAVCRAHGEWFHESGILHDFLREKGFASTRVVIEKQIVHLPGPTRLVEVLTPHVPDVPDCQPRIVGYARVSTEDQDLAVQLTKLREAKCDVLFEEKIGATATKRPQFDLMMKYLERGDSLVIYSLSRLGRDVKQIHAILDALAAEGVTWRSITEPHLDTKTAIGRFMVNMTGAKDQLERDQIKERTKHGMEELQRRGVKLGRQKLFDKKQTAAIKRDRKTMTRDDAAKKWRCSPGTIDKYAA